MPPRILRGSREHCLSGLISGEFDLAEYPLKTYGGHEAITIADEEVRIYQGVNPTPQRRFQVFLGNEAAGFLGFDLPGVVPFLVSSFQVSARHRVSYPKPTEIGLPLLTTEDGYMIRWMFGRNGARNAGHTLWRRLTQEELDQVPQVLMPDESIEPDARTGVSYQGVSGGVAAPEPAEYVQARAGGFPHEPWMARSVELANSWRVVVPNTSVSCRPVIVPPSLTIIGQNFNVILCNSSLVAIAIGIVLSRRTSRLSRRHFTVVPR